MPLGYLYKWKRRVIKQNGYTFSAGGEQGKPRFNNTLFVSSVLLTMYSKRGDIKSAYKVFKGQRERDLVSWNSTISGGKLLKYLRRCRSIT